MISKRKRRTFAPPDKISDVSSMIKPGSGDVLEVLVVWGSRIISTYHFKKNKTITIGGDISSDICIPINNIKKRKFIKFSNNQAEVFLSSDMLEGDLISSKGTKKPLSDFSNIESSSTIFRSVPVIQGEMVRVDAPSENLSIYIRFVNDSGKPYLIPFINFKTPLSLALLFSLLAVLFLGVYISMIPPLEPPEDEKKRRVVVQLRPPMVEEVKQPLPKIKKIAKKKVKPKPKPKKKILKKKTKIAKKKTVSKKRAPKKRRQSFVKKRGGKIVAVRKRARSIKTGKTRGATPRPRKDVRSQGLLSVFGKKGTQAKLRDSISGAGQVQGLATTSKGTSGQNINRAGGDLGSVKVGGLSKRSRQAQGVDNIGKLKGRGGQGLETSGSIGKRSGFAVEFDSEAGEFEGTINGDIVREVIRKNRRILKFCYEQALKKNSQLRGNLKLRWEIIESQGDVRGVRVAQSTINNRQVHSCFINRVRSLKFPGAVPDGQRGIIYYNFKLDYLN